MTKQQPILTAALLLLLLLLLSPTSAVDFIFNSFAPTDLLLVGDARVDSSVVRLSNDSNQFSIGRAFFPSLLPNSSSSFLSTSFVFSILPQIPSSPGFGLAFLLSNSTSPPGALSGQYFGIFSTRTSTAPLLAVEFDTGLNPEFNDPDGNHVGIDLDYVESAITHAAGYYRRPTGNRLADDLEFVPLDMRSGENIRAWIEFDRRRLQINVTIAPAGDPRPPRPLISYTNPEIASYLAPEMYVGFSASIVKWVEEQRILAWSLSDGGGLARELNTSNLPVFLPPPSPSSTKSLSAGSIAGISCAAIVLAILCFAGFYYYSCWYRKKRKIREESELEEWELKYWPRRFSYEDLWTATNGFSSDRLIGFGGFGKVYRGVLPISISRGSESGEGAEEEEVAVKCVSHESKQGLREFMAEISSMGRLEHKNLVHMRGWCRKRTELILVYEYMPNGNLSRWIFAADGRDDDVVQMGWAERRRVVADVAEGLLYLHQGWEKVVLHRDVKCSNILMDGEMRGRLGDFGLAKLYERGEAPGSTRVVGTLGYLAPELGVTAAPTAASDVYSYGVVVLEVVSGRRAIERAGRVEDDDWVLVEWVREMYERGRAAEVAAVEEEDWKREEVELLVKLGLACCHPDPDQRPTMREVVDVLMARCPPQAPSDLSLRRV